MWQKFVDIIHFLLSRLLISSGDSNRNIPELQRNKSFPILLQNSFCLTGIEMMLEQNRFKMDFIFRIKNRSKMGNE
jgi:hypothetical protein